MHRSCFNGISITHPVYITLNLNSAVYNNVKVSVLDNLCADLILAIDFQQQLKNVTFYFGGNKPDLSIYNLAIFKIEPPLLFQNLSDDC